MRDLIDATLKDMGPNWGGHPVHVQIPLSPPQVKFDVGLVKQVLEQLVDNAAKYSPAGEPRRIVFDLLVINFESRVVQKQANLSF